MKFDESAALAALIALHMPFQRSDRFCRLSKLYVPIDVSDGLVPCGICQTIGGKRGENMRARCLVFQAWIREG